jgi:hypothetical protein
VSGEGGGESGRVVGGERGEVGVGIGCLVKYEGWWQIRWSKQWGLLLTKRTLSFVLRSHFLSPTNELTIIYTMYSKCPQLTKILAPLSVKGGKRKREREREINVYVECVCLKWWSFVCVFLGILMVLGFLELILKWFSILGFGPIWRLLKGFKEIN